MSPSSKFVIALTLIAVLASPALAAWPNSPFTNRAVCTAAGDQSAPRIVSDGAGGAIVAWQDTRSGSTVDIYAQHVLASGVVDGAWPADGRAVCTAAGDQSAPRIVSDGAGGAIVTWYDLRSGVANDIYAQHVLASGAVDGAWPADGRALCTAAGDQSSPTIVADGAGGAIVTWYDLRSGTNYDIYAHHVLASGAVDGAWPADGRALCTATNQQYYPMIVADGAGGAIVTWQDARSGTNYDIYAQHVLASGVVDGAWPAEGQALCTATNSQQSPMIVSDGAGGAIATWYDYRNGYFDIYAQHVLASGAVDGAWPADGRALCTATNLQQSPMIVSDGAGGAIATWQDYRSGSYDIYAQRVARYGYLGTPEAEMAGVRDVPNDNGGKVKVSWSASYLDLAQDANLSAYDVYRSVPPNTAAAARAAGQVRLPHDGDLLPLDRGGLVTFPAASTVYAWEFVATVNPNHFAGQYSLVTSTAFDSLGAGNPRTAFLVLARNSSGSMFWPSRPDSGYSVDNIPPVTPSPFAANYAAGVVHLHWNPNPETDLAGYRLYRGASPSFTPSPATFIATPPDTGYADAAGATYTYKLTAIDVHGNESPVATLTPAAITGVDGGTSLPRELALAPASPNPASRGATLRYALPASERVSLGIYDAAGRLVRALTNGALPAGEHATAWDLRDAGGRIVGAGLYFARLDVGGHTLTRRIAVTP